MGAGSADRRRRRVGRPGDGVPARAAGLGPFGCDAAVVCDGPAALVPVRVGHRRRVGPGDPGRGSRLLPVAGVAGQAGPGRRRAPSCRSERGDRQARPGAEVRRVDPRALGDGAAGVLRLPSRRRDGPDGQPVPAVAGAGRWSGERPSQPDGALPQRAGGALSAVGRAADPARHPRRVVQSSVRRARLGSGPRAGRAVGVDRGAGGGGARGALRRRRPGPAADHGDPQGDARVAAGPGVTRCVRVAAALRVRARPGGADRG